MNWLKNLWLKIKSIFVKPKKITVTTSVYVIEKMPYEEGPCNCKVSLKEKSTKKPQPKKKTTTKKKAK